MKTINNRRDFLITSGLLGAGLLLPKVNFASSPTSPINDNVNVFGKRDGYSDEISILVSMMDWMRGTVLREVQNINQKELDFLLDDDSNSIGAMLMHLAATERFYQLDTFKGLNLQRMNFGVEEDVWNAASNLGNAARKTIKDKPLSFYMDTLAAVREFSKDELSNQDDSWLMESTVFWNNAPVNNYCKWFHVVEHESNHNGQIRFIKKRIV